MVYELWDGETANIVGAFESEAAAIAAVGRALQEQGPAYVASLVLGRENEDGDSVLISTGSDLVERATAFLAGTVALAVPSGNGSD